MTQAPTSPSNPSAPIRTPLSDSPGAVRFNSAEGTHKSKFIKMLIYGSPGMGKTTLAASSVDVSSMSDVLLVSAEGGDMVLEDNSRIKNLGAMDEVRVQRMEQLQKVYEYLRVHCQARDTNNEAQLKTTQAMVFGYANADEMLLSMPLRRYKTIVIDSLTEIEAQNLSKILGFDDSVAFDAGEETNVAGFAEFRKNNNIVQRIVRSLRDLPINVIIVCAEAYTQDELKRFHYAPALTGKLASQIQGFVDVVGRLIVSSANQAQADLRRLYVQPVAAQRFDAKNRRAGFKEPFLDDPTMSSIMKAFKLV